MIEVERMNNQKVFINPDLVTMIETAPDTILTFKNGEKIVLKTSPQEIIDRIVQFRKRYMLPEIK